MFQEDWWPELSGPGEYEIIRKISWQFVDETRTFWISPGLSEKAVDITALILIWWRLNFYARGILRRGGDTEVHVYCF